MQIFSTVHRLPLSLSQTAANILLGKVRRTVLWFFCLGVCIALPGELTGAAQATPVKPVQETRPSDIPWELGEVIYRINPDSAKQLYIIGISHRDPDSGRGNGTTLQTQMEVYRLGEWLNKNHHLNLLLPEGYFEAGISRMEERAVPRQAVLSETSTSLDDAVLLERLATEDFFVNAEMLLMEQLDFHASQIEDRNIYDAVRTSLGRLRKSIELKTDSAANIAELRYLQRVRTASLLQKIPEAIQNDVNNGSTGSYSALFTIGLAHLTTIHRYIEDHGIHLNPPENSEPFQDLSGTNLGLLEEKYGVTIIIPRTLANNTSLLRRTSIDRIVSRKDSPTQL